MPQQDRFSVRPRRVAMAASAGLAAAVLALAPLVPSSASAAATAPAAAASVPAIVPMAAGVAEAPASVWSEGFENKQANIPTQLGGYASTTGATFTADAYWLNYANCNGVLVNYGANLPLTQGVANFPTGLCSNENASVSQVNVRRMADVLGQVAAGVTGGTSAAPANGSTASTRANHAVTAWTTSENGTSDLRVIDARSLGLNPTASRYYTASIDVVEASCSYQSGANTSKLDVYFVIGASERKLNAAPISACTAAASGWYTSPVPANSTQPNSTAWGSGGASVSAGRFTADGAQLLTAAEAAALTLRVRNQTGTGDGNDFAFDNLRLLDATPSLDKSFSPATITAGETSTLTFTITNTTEGAAKNDLAFTDNLPAGLVVAANPALGGTCRSTTGDALVFSAAAGASTVSLSGVDLAAGAMSCTGTVAVTASAGGSYTNGPGNVVTNLNPPDAATLTVNAPSTITIQKNVVARNAGSDQFRLGLRNAANTADIGSAVTTSGAATGVQAAKAGPIVVTAGTTYTIREQAAGSTALSNYTSAWQCFNGGTLVASGTGTSGTVTMPPATTAGVALVCTFTNALLRAQVTVAKEVRDAAGGNPQPGTGWVLGLTPSGATASPAAQTQTTPTSGSVAWTLTFANSSSRARVVVAETQKPTHDFASAQCTVTGMLGTTRTVTVPTAAGGTVDDVAPGDTVACGFINRLKPTTLTLAATVAAGGPAATSWTLNAGAPNGALAGPNGATGTGATTNVPVTPSVAYTLGYTGGSPLYLPENPWSCLDRAGAAVAVTSDGKLTLTPGTQVVCSIRFATAQLTLLKHVVTPSSGFQADTWTVKATPAAGQVGLATETRVGAEPGSTPAQSGASTFAVRPGHGYSLSEQLTDAASTLAYQQIALQRLAADGTWVDLDSAQITAPAAGQSATYRFVNDKVPALVLPLTGGASTDAFLIGGGALIVTAGVLVLLRRRRSRRMRPELS